MATEEEFKAAVKRAESLPKRPSNDDLLELYSYFKQATSGDVSGKRPGMLDMKGRAKYDAWAKRKGLSADDARAGYVKTVERLGG